MIAVADTGPLLYLSLIDRAGLLPQIFETVLIPQAVADELSHPSTPIEAAALIERCPDWLHICTVPSADSSLDRLERGEREAITLAVSAGADLLLTDDAAAKRTATQAMGLAASGTIGVLYEAAMNDLVPFTATEFDQAIERLLTTNFYFAPALRKYIAELSRKLHDLSSSARRGGTPG